MSHYEPLDILSLQSGVIWGAVGNDAAMPVYQHHRISAGRFDTVRLAAHPGFGTMRAQITHASELEAALSDFAKLDISQDLKFCQTGYLGSADQIPILATFIQQMKAHTSDIAYCLDPVLGDGGRLYVKSDIQSELIKTLLPLADIITPNQFELGLLANAEISNVTSALSAAHSLIQYHKRENAHAPVILVTGITDTENMHSDTISDLFVTSQHHWVFTHPRRARGVSGSGDTLTALFLSQLVNGKNPEDAASYASTVTARIIANSPSERFLNIKGWLAHPNEPV